jgi:hypothetical protein
MTSFTPHNREHTFDGSPSDHSLGKSGDLPNDPG